MSLNGNMKRKVRLGDEEFIVGPFTLGDRRRLAKVLAGVKRPEVVPVDVKGVIEAMHLTPSDETLGAALQGLPASMIQLHLGTLRREIQTTILTAVDRARALAESWPPDPISTVAFRLYLDDEGLGAAFIQTILSHDLQDNGTITRERAIQIADSIRYPLQWVEIQKALGLWDEEGVEDPKSSASGGDGGSQETSAKVEEGPKTITSTVSSTPSSPIV